MVTLLSRLSEILIPAFSTAMLDLRTEDLGKDWTESGLLLKELKLSGKHFL